MLFFEIQEVGPLNDENKLRRKEQQKLKRLKKIKLNIINFKTVRYKLSACGNHSFNLHLQAYATGLQFCGYLKNKKKQEKTANSRKNSERKVWKT